MITAVVMIMISWSPATTTPKISKVLPVNSAGVKRASPPQMSMEIPRMTMRIPRVTIIRTSGGWPRSRSTARYSMISPTAPAVSTPMAMAG